MIIVSTGWSDPPDVVKARLARFKKEGLDRYAKMVRDADKAEEQRRHEKEEAARIERERQEALRVERMRARKQAAKHTPQAELEREREKARRNMEKLQERARANLEARTARHARAGTSALSDPGDASSGKPKVRGKSAAV